MDITFGLRLQAFFFRNLSHLLCYFDIVQPQKSQNNFFRYRLLQGINWLDNAFGNSLEITTPLSKAATCMPSDKEFKRDLIVLAGLFIGLTILFKEKGNRSLSTSIILSAATLIGTGVYLFNDLGDEQNFDKLWQCGL